MRRPWVVAAAVMVSALSSVLFARMGTVVTKDGTSFDGDITENQAAGTVTVLTHGIRTELKNANVQSITYVDQVVAAVNAKLAALAPDDMNGRLALAQYAMDHHAPAAARDALLSAQRINPKDPDVRDLLERVAAQLRAEAPPPVTQPAAVGAPTTAPATIVDRAPTTAPAASGQATRMVTDDEINYIRQCELQSNENARVRIDSDLRRRFTGYVNMPMADFSALSPIQQAFLILDKGSKSMRRGVKILSDPSAVAQYRRDVQHVLIVGCATSKCHGGAGVGGFRLFQQDTLPASYTNFLILQQYSMQSHGRRIPLVNRQQPEQSRLLSYMLPAALTDDPHPEAKGYHGAVRNRADVRFAATLAWIQALNPVNPDYSRIDLTQPPTTQPSEAAVSP